MTSAKEPEKDKTGKPAVAKAPAKASAQVPAASRADASAARRRLRRVSKGKPAWDKDRTRELFRRYKEEGDEEAREQLIVSHVNLVRYIAAKFKNRGEPLDDLIQVGTIGLIKAIDRFDPSRGLEFTTYATPTIMGEIKRHFRDKGWTIRVPRRLQELSAKVNTVTDELTAELQRSPSIDEIAARLGTTPDEVLEAMESSSAYSSVPLEGQGGTEEDDAPAVIDRYASVDNDLEASDDRMILEDVISEFPEADQQAIRMRYLDGMTQVEIAKKLGISQVQVSRMLRRALRRIQEKIDPEGLMR
ncbi:MAG: B/F/G family RNA polymerase sigma-70 factor [Coriobacteriia bacterium]|nr:MAG: B/F/G family RNA polymerase sigma-70 factor [Coriobacteriia bacterium]